MSKSLEGKTAVVLGASQRGGGGWTAAEVLASEGAHVWVAARRIDRVEELAGEIGGHAFQCNPSCCSRHKRESGLPQVTSIKVPPTGARKIIVLQKKTMHIVMLQGGKE